MNDYEMSGVNTLAVSDNKTRRVLEAFITENPELARLEALLGQFNIFEALGVVRHEVRHSDFLAYLLSPQANHNLQDAFIKVLLQSVIASVSKEELPITRNDLMTWDMQAAIVQREWHRIDIFLRDEVHQFSLIVENKIDTGEHDDQLSRYYERVCREFPNDRVLALYLTKEGDEPSDDRYIPVGYGLICEAVENLAERHVSTLDRDAHTLMTHYAQMLRRHIMSDTEIARLCGLIYRKHKAALDLIYEHRPSEQSQITQFLELLIDQTAGLRRGGTHKGRYIGFGPPELDNLPRETLYFVFDNAPDAVVLRMQIKANNENRELCRRIFDLVSINQPPFNLDRRSMNKIFTTIFSRVFLSDRDYTEADSQEREDKIRRCWEQFLSQDLPAIRRVFAEADWFEQLKSQEPQPL